jgi:hypothetical protein
LETGLEPHAVRMAAEYWEIAVSATWVGNSKQIVDYLQSRPSHDIIVLSAHGDEGRLCLPELGAEIRDRYPYNDFITADQFREFVRLDGSVFLSLACSTGTPALASAFLEGGASMYIGPAGYPNGSDALKFCLDFLYAWSCLKRPLADCVSIARGGCPDGEMFRSYEREHLQPREG